MVFRKLIKFTVLATALFCGSLNAIVEFPVEFVEQRYVDSIPENKEYILGGDIGGTNSCFGIFSVENAKPVLLLSYKTDSQKIVNFSKVVKQVLETIHEKYAITIKQACIGAPGPTSPNKDFSKSYWMPSAIDAKDIIKNTGLENVIIINDFEIIGYGIDLINPNDIIKLNDVEPRPKAAKSILGAGTGLGTALMTWNEAHNRYQCHAQGGGLLDFAPQTDTEYAITNYLRSTLGGQVRWSSILSGSRGIPRIYDYLGTTGLYDPTMTLEETHPAAIFNNRDKSPRCQDTVDLFMSFYARFIREMAKVNHPYGGLYIAGGVAAKNIPLFQKLSFLNQVQTSENDAVRGILKQVPLYLIADYNVSLYGAAQYLLLESEKKQADCLLENQGFFSSLTSSH